MKMISLETADGRSVAREVRIADSFVERSVGLLRYRRLEDEQGILLVPGGSVHTLGMRFPIDVVFLDRRMRVLSFAANVPPNRFRLAPTHTAHVLELACGRVRQTGLLIGQYVLVAHDGRRDGAELPTVRMHGGARETDVCARSPVQFSLRLSGVRCERRTSAPRSIPLARAEHSNGARS